MTTSRLSEIYVRFILRGRPVNPTPTYGGLISILSPYIGVGISRKSVFSMPSTAIAHGCTRHEEENADRNPVLRRKRYIKDYRST